MSMDNKNLAKNNSVLNEEEKQEEIDNDEYCLSDEDDDQRSFLVLAGENGERQQQEQMSTSQTVRPPQLITGCHLSDAIRAVVENENFSGVRPISIFSFNEDGKLMFKGREWLKELAQSPEYKNKLISPIVNAGKFRQGKSMTVNLKAEAFEIRGNSRPLECGFEWSGGDLAITSGILCWPKPIQVQLPIGEGGSLVDVLILLFDVQGFFDATESHVDIRLCTIANLISTIFVYHVKHTFDSQQLHSLQKMLTLGLSVVDRKLEKETGNEGDQNEIQQNIHLQIPILYFIVRDCPRSAKNSVEGGKLVLDRWIKNPPPTTNGDLLASAKYLLDLYQHIDCFCLPMPADGLLDEILEERLRIRGVLRLVSRLSPLVNSRLFDPSRLSFSSLVFSKSLSSLASHLSYFWREGEILKFSYSQRLAKS